MSFFIASWPFSHSRFQPYLRHCCWHVTMAGQLIIFFAGYWLRLWWLILSRPFHFRRLLSATLSPFMATIGWYTYYCHWLAILPLILYLFWLACHCQPIRFISTPLLQSLFSVLLLILAITYTFDSCHIDVRRRLAIILLYCHYVID